MRRKKKQVRVGQREFKSWRVLTHGLETLYDIVNEREF